MFRMKLPSHVCLSLQNHPSPTQFWTPQLQTVRKHLGSHAVLMSRKPRIQFEFKSFLPSLRRGVVLRAGNLNSSLELWSDERDGSEPFRGKSGSVSFGGLSHQSIEESKLESAPFKEDTGSFLWVFAPAAFIASLVVHLFVVDAIEEVYKNKVFADQVFTMFIAVVGAEILCSFSTEVIFYAGLAVFLFVADRVQKPYLQFSSKRWSLITGLRGYLASSFFIMGLKVFTPIIAAYITWPDLGLTALVSVAPFLVGCLAQYAFEKILNRNGSSCWPLLPIIFEVYRMYQLTRATSFIEKFIYVIREASPSADLMNRAGALFSLIATFRILGVVCLWSLLTFLLRLFPSRPVAENY